jgi:predicted SAM-dependent methyltransferase
MGRALWLLKAAARTWPLRSIRARLVAMRRRQRRAWRIDVSKFIAPGEPVQLNVGCGSKAKPGWVNIDLSPAADLVLDVREGLPFDDYSCDLIYSEHFLEHLIYPDESVSFLEECLRVLKVDGRIEIGVPDARYVVESCRNDPIDPDFLATAALNNWRYPESCRTGFEYINFHFRMGEQHKFAFDLTTLKLHLEDAGFGGIRQRAFDPSLDCQKRAVGTLYVVGTIAEVKDEEAVEGTKS